MVLSIGMLIFPIWGIALFASATKALGIPLAFDLVAVLAAVFSPMPIVFSERFGVFAKVALFFVYLWFAVPIAFLTLFLVVGQA